MYGKKKKEKKKRVGHGMNSVECDQKLIRPGETSSESVHQIRTQSINVFFSANT